MLSSSASKTIRISYRLKLAAADNGIMYMCTHGTCNLSVVPVKHVQFASSLLFTFRGRLEIVF